MGKPPSDTADRRLDLAARAAWLYYIRRRTQDEIAAVLNVSRQNAQRLVALALSEGLIKFRLDHPVAACAELADRLTDAFGLLCCDVTPTDRDAPDTAAGIAIAAADRIEAYLSQKAPATLALGTGRTLLAAVAEVPTMERPQHKIISLVGNLTRDGRASPYEVVMRLADRVGAQCYPLPLPVVADSEEERRMLQAQRSYTKVGALVAEARAVFVGIGGIGWNMPLHADGFITDAELSELMDAGAVGEILGWAFDDGGRLLATGSNARLTAHRLPPPADRPIIIVGAGPGKLPALRAALHGRLASGLITDEATAAAILAD
ncbi:sugar-binding transcriptional regulator [Azospirillum halopraeferens]|uniref:sugar-binding transcriptional regulator n=1 Tax=Azospirillum halopraeferens TaxID=34010 RepID=UPI0003FE184F|nr:sugar-binding transcriptional regulator [Azospirillum halopraeferens]